MYEIGAVKILQINISLACSQNLIKTIVQMLFLFLYISRYFHLKQT